MMTGGRADGLTGRVSLSVLALMLAALVPASARAQTVDDGKVISAYRLTDASLNRFIAASRGMVAVARQQADTAEEEDEGEGDPSIDEIAAFYDKNPGLRRALASAGMTSREYVTFMFAMFQAGMGAWLVEQQGWKSLPADISRANVEFYQRHKARLDSLSAELKDRN